ncbi:MAG: glycerol-3-phosphate 1-O-acyltransferase PlsY [bacterium]
MLPAGMALAGGYLIGSIPFGWLVARAHGINIQEAGSGNIGATNVYRTVGRIAGIGVLILDVLKGAVPVLIAPRIAGELLPLAAGLGALAGHLWPVWLKFKGGKGVATGLGVFLCLAPVATLVGLSVFIAVVTVTRFISLGSVTGACALAAITYLRPHPDAVRLTAALAAAAIILKHLPNMRRIATGTESRWSR